MTAPKSPPGRGAPNDQAVQALLQRLNCPTPLHVLRMLLLGSISSPRLDVSPMVPLAQAWGGELPAFSATAETEEFVEVLVRGLWNRLADHQHARQPFRLPRFEVAPNRQALHDLARRRADELRGFVDGLFGDDDELALAHKAHEAVLALADLHAMFDGAVTLLADASQPAPEKALKALLRHLQQLTIAADEQINKVVQACKRARGQHMDTIDTVPAAHPWRGEADDGDDDGFGDADEPDFVDSPLSRTVTRNGVTVRIAIYADDEAGWILEVVDAEQASHVWEQPFETDAQALAAALKALDEEPLDFFGREGGQALN